MDEDKPSNTLTIDIIRATVGKMPTSTETFEALMVLFTMLLDYIELQAEHFNFLIELSDKQSDEDESNIATLGNALSTAQFKDGVSESIIIDMTADRDHYRTIASDRKAQIYRLEDTCCQNKAKITSLESQLRNGETAKLEDKLRIQVMLSFYLRHDKAKMCEAYGGSYFAAHGQLNDLLGVKMSCPDYILMREYIIRDIHDGSVPHLIAAIKLYRDLKNDPTNWGLKKAKELIEEVSRTVAFE